MKWSFLTKIKVEDLASFLRNLKSSGIDQRARQGNWCIKDGSYRQNQRSKLFHWELWNRSKWLVNKQLTRFSNVQICIFLRKLARACFSANTLARGISWDSRVVYQGAFHLIYSSSVTLLSSALDHTFSVYFNFSAAQASSLTLPPLQVVSFC